MLTLRRCNCDKSKDERPTHAPILQTSADLRASPSSATRRGRTRWLSSVVRLPAGGPRPPAAASRASQLAQHLTDCHAGGAAGGQRREGIRSFTPELGTTTINHQKEVGQPPLRGDARMA
jgi:hypothetical protein